MQLIIRLDKQFFEWLTINLNPVWLGKTSEMLGDTRTYVWPILIFIIIYSLMHRISVLRFILLFLLLLFISESIDSFLKWAVARPRPAVAMGIYFDPKAFSFPSAHAVNTMATAVFLSRWFMRKEIWFISFSLIIGISRVFANYHFPLDVICGWLIGYAIGRIYWRVVAVHVIRI